MSDTGSAHRASSLSSIHFLDLDGGNDQNQTDEKNRDQPKQKEKQINETIENTTQ